jgi:hypothetical protein
MKEFLIVLTSHKNVEACLFIVTIFREQIDYFPELISPKGSEKGKFMLLPPLDQHVRNSEAKSC